MTTQRPFNVNNPVGIISMQFVRPFTRASLGIFQQIRNLGFDFVELLVPEPEDDLDLHETAAALRDADLDVVLAARVNLQRSIASADPQCRLGGIEYLNRCVDVAKALDARIIGGPLYGEPLVFAGRAPLPGATMTFKGAPTGRSRALPRLPRAQRTRAASSPWKPSTASKPILPRQRGRPLRSVMPSAIPALASCWTRST